MSVIDFPMGDSYLEGPAICMRCDHQWTLVMPVGTDHENIRCPSCGLHFGVRSAGCVPEEGESWFECSCGGHLFYIEGPPEDAAITCYMCGEIATF